MSTCSSSECSFEAFEPRQSLWKLVEEFLPLEEQREIKAVLGEDIIDETSDLHREVLVLLEIWQDYRDESEKESKEVSLNCHYQRLPEPPEMRGNLKKEIQLFVTALKQRSVENGSTERLALSKREESIVDYVFKKAEEPVCLPTRPTTAVSSESGRSTPGRPSSSSSRSWSSLTDVMESFQEQLNVQDVDQLAERLRNILHEEKNLLLEDITFLQNSLFEESHFVDNQHANDEEEPSLQELKELGMKLEKEMTMKDSPTPRNSSSPARRPARARHIVRSSSYPASGTASKPSRPKDKKPSRSQAETLTAPASGKLRSSESNSPPMSAVSRNFGSSSPPTSAVIRKSGEPMSSLPPTSAVSKRTGSESLSPSPPSSAALRKPVSASSRFRKMILDTRQGDCSSQNKTNR